jgi:hypothetical protein
MEKISPRDTQLEFYETYANTMTQWASLEDGLGAAFFPLFGTKSFLAQSIFYAQRGLNTKRAMVDSAFVAFSFGTILYEKWQKISNKLQKTIDDRNKLTHGQLLVDCKSDGSMTETITTPIRSVSSLMKGKAFKFRLKDIEQMRLRASAVRDDLHALGAVVAHLVSPATAAGFSRFSLPDALSRLELENLDGLSVGKRGCLDAVFPDD